MPIDGSYIQGTIASQQAYFAQHQAYINNLNVMGSGQMGMGSSQPMTPTYPAPPPPPLPTAMWQSGMYNPPGMSSPYYTSGMGLARGLMGFSPDPMRFNSTEAYRAAQNQAAGYAGDVAVGVAGAIPKVAGMGMDLLGYTGLAMGGVGLAPTLAAGYGLSKAVDWASKPIQWGVENWKMSRQMQMEFAMNPRLNRLGSNFGEFSKTSTMMQSMAGEYEGPSMGDLTQVMSIGVAGGQFDTARNMGEFREMFRKQVAALRNISKTVKVSLAEGAQLMNDLKQMGFFDMNSQVQQLTNMAGVANLSGMGMQEVAGVVGAGSQMLGGPWGGRMAGNMLGNVGYLSRFGSNQNMELINRVGGAAQATTGLMQGLQSSYQSTSMGTIMLAQQATGLAGGNLSAISGALARNPALYSTLMNAQGRNELLGSMTNPTDLLRDFQSRLKQSNMPSWMINDPAFLSNQLGLTLDQTRLALSMNTPGARQAAIRQRAQNAASNYDWLAEEGVGGAVGAGSLLRETSRELSTRVSMWRESTMQPGGLGAEIVSIGRGASRAYGRFSGAEYLRNSTGISSTLSEEDLSNVSRGVGRSGKGTAQRLQEASESERKILRGKGNWLARGAVALGVPVLGPGLAALMPSGSDKAADTIQSLLEGSGAESQGFKKQYAAVLAGESKGEALRTMMIGAGMTQEEAGDALGKILANRKELQADYMSRAGVELERTLIPTIGEDVYKLRGSGFKEQEAALKGYQGKMDYASFAKFAQSVSKLTGAQRDKFASISTLGAGVISQLDAKKGINEGMYKDVMNLLTQEQQRQSESEATISANNVVINNPNLEINWLGSKGPKIKDPDNKGSVGESQVKGLNSNA